jgi:hypothetical protein
MKEGMKLVTETEIPTEFFISFFQPSVRVLFDWDRAKREKWPVRIDIINNLEFLADWYLPWYINSSGRETIYSEPDAKPLLLPDIPLSLLHLSQQRQERIISLAKSYEQTRPPVQLVVPLYALGKTRSLVLDGNHRLAALVITKVAFTILVMKLYGPCDDQVLPDLIHWSDFNQLME